MSGAGRRGSWAAGRWKLPVLSGLLLALAYCFPLGLPVFVAFVPMLRWLDARRDRPIREVVRGGVIFGVVTYGIILHWIYAMLSISWLAVLMYLGLVILFTAGSAAAFALAARCRSSTGWSFGLLLPVCWIPVEWIRNWGDLRMTADHVAHILAPYPFLVQFADLLGPYGVGAVALATNGLIYEIARTRGAARRRSAATLAILAVLVLAYDAWAWTHPPREEGRLRVALVQPNIPLFFKRDPATDAEQGRVLAELTLQAARERPDLILWPESARPEPLYHWLDRPETFAMPDVQGLAATTGAALLTGAEYVRIREASDYEVYNAALVAHPDGRLDPAWTAKVYLVPFTEGVPFKRLLGPLLSGLGGDLRWLAGGFTPGPAAAVLDVGGARVGALICYEEFYFDLARELRNAGAGFQVILTNDAWFGRTVFQRYQADSVRLRAIETRSAFVRVANTGISGFVDPMGRYHGRTGLFVPAVEVREVPVTRGRTVYARTGDVVAWLAIGGLAAALVAARGTRRRGNAGEGAADELESGRSVVGSVS